MLLKAGQTLIQEQSRHPFQDFTKRLRDGHYADGQPWNVTPINSHPPATTLQRHFSQLPWPSAYFDSLCIYARPTRLLTRNGCGAKDFSGISSQSSIVVYCYVKVLLRRPSAYRDVYFEPVLIPITCKARNSCRGRTCYQLYNI